LDYYDNTICLKGFLIILYYRIKDRRADNTTFFGPLLYFFHIIICLFLTPICLGIISNYLGFILHRKKTEYCLKWKLLPVPVAKVGLIISILKGLLMFPYIITFFPFMVILLIPSIFSFQYYLYIYNMFFTIICPGSIRANG